MKAIQNRIEKAIELETQLANKKFPPFNSNHEGLAVIREEYKEVLEEVKQLKSDYKDFEYCVFNDMLETDINMWVDFIKQSAITLACEAVQVGAMCDKFKAMGATNDADN